MRTLPILFSTPMVQALLDKRKTQTRRLIKPQPHLFINDTLAPINPVPAIELGNGIKQGIFPKYHVGDILYARETHYAYGWWVKKGKTKTGKDKWMFKDFTGPNFVAGEKYYYEDCPPAEIITGRKEKVLGFYKRPSLFMPKAAARIFLKVTGVRPERLQDISEEDAIAEGIEWKIKYPDEAPDVKYWRDYAVKERFAMGIRFGPIQSFKTLFQSINGPESWNRNDWVWVYTFEQITKPQ